MKNNISIFVLLALVNFTLLVSCSPKLQKGIVTVPKIFYPKGEDTAKFQYLGKINTSIDINSEANQTSFNASFFGKQYIERIVKPYGLEINDGKIYVSDLANRIDIIDLKKKNFTYFAPTEAGTIGLPLNTSVDTEGNLYICDVKGKQIKIFNKNKTFNSKIQYKDFLRPTDVVVTNDKIWVCDADNHKIYVFNKKSRQLMYSFPETFEEAEDWLFFPTSIVVNSNKVFVGDQGGHNIKVFTHKGEHIKTIGQYGSGFGMFSRIKGIAVDKEENIFAIDGVFQNIQIFNKDGDFLMHFGDDTGKSGSLVLPTTMAIDYNLNEYYEHLVDPKYELKYVLMVASQYGNKISIYGRIELKDSRQ